MGLKYLMDTNVLSDLVRHPQGVISQRIAMVGESTICTSIVVASELRFGAAKKGSNRLTRQLDAILAVLEILPLDSPADAYYAKLRWQLERAGMPIGPNDMLIASQALAMNLTVVTANVREFRRVHGLSVENWLEQ